MAYNLAFPNVPSQFIRAIQARQGKAQNGQLGHENTFWNEFLDGTESLPECIRMNKSNQDL